METQVDWIKVSVQNSVEPHEFDKKHLKKAEGWIGQNVVNMAIKMKTIVWIIFIHFICHMLKHKFFLAFFLQNFAFL